MPWKSKEPEDEGVILVPSVSKSFDKSMDIRNMSISLYRSLTGSGINESRMSRSKSSRMRDKSKGFDLGDIFQSGKSFLSSSTRTNSSGIKLIDCQTFV